MSIFDQTEYWTKIAHRNLTTFERMVIARPFRYNTYWKNWSRILKPIYSGYPNGYVDINLTPINGWADEKSNSPDVVNHKLQVQIREISAIRIHNHSTPSTDKDQYEETLPIEAMDKLVEMVGPDLANYMLNGNIYNLIDWRLYRNAENNGGVPLDTCSAHM